MLREFDYFFWKEIEQRKLASVEAMDGRNKGSRYSCIATLRIYVPERTLREKILMQIGIKPEIAVSDIPL